MQRLTARLLIASLIFPLAHAAAQPLPTDPRLVTGTLDNGLNYIVRKHDNPPGRVELLLHISTGSLNETDKQRGIAHFTEHMAFNGSANFPPGSVIKFFESLGLTFGQHQNASTSFDQTSYMLSLPDTKPETLQKGMLFLSDVASHLSIPEAEIENERQVILEERRSRLSGRQRVQDYWFEHLAPGSILGNRIPIGVEETINGVKRQDFLDYISKWYTPSNMTMMVVADMDPAVVVEQIKASLSKGPKVEQPRDQDVAIKPYDKTRAIIASDEELTDARIELIWIAPPEIPTTTVELLRRDMVDRIATWCFDRRIDQKIAEAKVSFQRGSPISSDLFRAAHLSVISVSGEPAKWKQMLADVSIEVQRARLHGFREQEVADARAEILSATENSVKTESTMNAGSMLAMWSGAIAAGVPITSAQQDLDAITKVLPTIKPEDVSKRFNELFDTSKPLTFSLQLPSSAEIPTEAQLIELGTKALDVKPDNETTAARPTAFMTKLPESGTITEQSEHAATAVTSAWLSNNARVHYRFMDYKKDQVIITIMVAGGEIQETPANRGITQAAAIGLSTTATSTLTSTNIRDLLTGKNVGVRGRPAPDAMMLTVAGNPTDLEHGMQLAHLLMTDAVVEIAALGIWKEQVRQFAENRTKAVELALGDVVAKNLYPANEFRFGPLEPEQANRHTPEAATAWLRQVHSSGPIEVSIVGDLPKERAMELVQRYIGSLPKRPRIAESLFADLRKLQRPAGPLKADKALATATDKAIFMSGFYGTDAKNLKDVRLLNMASRILSSRAIQDIREKQQLAYAPQVGSSPAAEYPGMGFVFFASPTDPQKVEAVRAAVTSLFDTFAKDGASPDEMDTVRKQLANTLDEQMREPNFWSTRLTTLDYRGNSLDDVLNAPAAYQAFTADEVREAFNRYYKPANRFEFSVSPAPAKP